MNLVSLHKLFLLKRAIERFNRRIGWKINQTHIFLLFVLYSGRRSGSTMTEIDTVLRKTTHTRSKNDIQKGLRRLIEEGWVDTEGKNIKKYRLALAGRNALNDLEKGIRRQRVDRI